MMKKNWLGIGLIVALAGVGCGDDGGTTDTDAGTVDGGGTTEVTCPNGTPETDGRIGPCCARVDNMDAADFGLRVAGMEISKPASLASPLIQTSLNAALIEERFTWLVDITGAAADGDVSIRTGFGDANCDGTFAFAVDGAPDEPVDRWNPITVAGTLANGNYTTGTSDATFTLPIFTDDGELSIELPARAFTLQSMNVTDANTCVGTAGTRGYDVTDDAGDYVAELTVYITMADSMERDLVIPGAIDDNLCDFLAGNIMTTDPADYCAEVDITEFTYPPDAYCDEAGACTTGSAADCGDNTCNAWELQIAFAAHGVSISN